MIALFAMTALMALAVSTAVYGTPFTSRAVERLLGFSICVLAMLKLRDVETFATMFLNYEGRRNPGAGRRRDHGAGTRDRADDGVA